MRFAERIAIDPGFQAAELDSGRGALASAPHLHALQFLVCPGGHGHILPGNAATQNLAIAALRLP
jgi:hypothetical protein